MVWSTPYTATVGTVLTAATWNTYVRDDLAYLKGLLDGTGGATAVTVPADLFIQNDVNYAFTKSGANPAWIMDANDYLIYDRTNNALFFQTGGVIPLSIAASGKLTGAGIYRPAEVSIAAAGTATFTHGLGALPLLVTGLYGASSGAEQNPLVKNGSEVYVNTVTSTQFTVTNQSAGTKWVLALALL